MLEISRGIHSRPQNFTNDRWWSDHAYGMMRSHGMINYLSCSQPRQNSVAIITRRAWRSSNRVSNESIAWNVTGDKYPIDIDPLNGLLWAARTMLTQHSYFGAGRRGAAWAQTARYRVDNPPADSYKCARCRRAQCLLSTLYRGDFERDHRMHIRVAEIVELNDPNFAECEL